MTMLAPGAYRLTGKYQGQISGRRGMVWRVNCAGAGGLLGETPMILGIAPKWKDFELSFTVPATACRAQSVRLDLGARSASEIMVPVDIVFDELRHSLANMNTPNLKFARHSKHYWPLSSRNKARWLTPRACASS